MNPYAIPPAISAILIAGIGFFVYRQDPKNLLNKVFGGYSLCLVTWLLGFAAMYASHEPHAALVFAKLGFIGVAFIPPTVFHFTMVLINKRSRWRLRLLYLTGFLGILLVPTSMIYGGIRLWFWGYYPVAGPIYPFFPIIFLIAFLGSTFSLWKAWQRTMDARRRDQLRCVMWACACALPGIVDYLIKFGIPAYPFAYISALLWNGLIAYGILRHRLLNIEIIIKRTVVFAGLVVAVVTMVSFTTLAFQEPLSHLGSFQSRLWPLFVSAVLIALVYGPLHSMLASLTDRFLFQKPYDYKVLLRRFTDEVLVMVDLKPLVQKTQATLKEVMRITECHLYLSNPNNNSYETVVSSNGHETASFLSKQDPLPGYLIQRKEPIEVDSTWAQSPELLLAQTQLRERGLCLCFPIFQSNDLIGLLALGRKKSDKPFSQDDYEVLRALTKTLGIALNNATLYDRVLRLNLELSSLNSELEHRVEDRTKQLMKRNQQLVDASRVILKAQEELESFVYTVSHDLKAPVVSLHGIASILIEEFEELPSDQIEYYLKRLMANADFMEQLIIDLLDFSRIGRRNLEFIRIDCDELIRNVLDQCHGYIRQRRASIRVQERLPRITFDPVLLKQIFMNLITNGLKFMGDQPEPQIEIGGSESDGVITYFVKDNGIGISPEYHETIFGVFQRLKEVDVEGTGIGLSMVKKVVDLAGGKIWLRSEKGEGATFFFSLPSREITPPLPREETARFEE